MVRIKVPSKLTLYEMMIHYELYQAYPEGLLQLPVPIELRFEKIGYKIPKESEELAAEICYGQRLYFTQKEDDDFGTILRLISGYYYPVVTGEKWDSDRALLFREKVLTCIVEEIYPTAMHISQLIKGISDKENKLLHREPSKMELAAGIERLDIYSELSSLDFLRDNMKITIPEVLLTPYNECLVRFMMAKEIADYQERYFKLQMELAKDKKKDGSKA